MKTTQFCLEYKLVDNSKKTVVAIILCAGSSMRMKGINKQFSVIGGIPVIARSLLAFEKNKWISGIVVAAKPDDILSIQQIAQEYNVSKLTDIVIGGNSRAESVKNAFNVLSEETDFVLIHDGARPLVSQSVIDGVVSNLNTFDAVACAVPVKDTIKVIDESKKIFQTLNRNNLCAMQTPQGFKYDIYMDALSKFQDISSFTDDCALVEKAGYDVFVVDGDNRNIKITTREDLIIADAFLKEKSDE